SHAAKPNGRYFQVASSKFALLHWFSLQTVSLHPRVGSNAADTVARSFLLIAYFSCNVKNSLPYHEPSGYLLARAGNSIQCKTPIQWPLSRQIKPSNGGRNCAVKLPFSLGPKRD